jgi:pyruvate/2-oxoglutarate dehydrogenase complex dihydrolipoamide acyltransferase (E2) component
MKGAWAVLVVIGCTVDARALGSLADVEILDRDTGATLPTYRHHGEYWVAGRPGARFSIVIHNRGSERLLAVTAVDGVNVISGETGAWLQTGYVFDSQQGYEIPGWRKSNSEVADFNFTTAADSYASRTDRPANVGVIGVALFREQHSTAPAVAQYDQQQNASASRRSAPSTPAPDAPRPAELAAERSAQAARSATEQSFASAAPKLGTGHGAREVSYVRDVEFNRASNTPNEIIRIRYDSLDNLVAMGIVSPRTAPWPVPKPFPDSPDHRYVPDPPGG